VPAGLEADRVDRGVDLGDAEDLLDLILGLALGDVDRLAPERARLRQALGDHVADDHDRRAQEAPATVLNSIMDIARAGASPGIPGLYVTGAPGGIDDAAKVGSLSIRIGLGWAKSHSFTTGQCPVMRYHRGLMKAILNDRVQIAKAVNATVISLDDAPQGYQDFDKGAARKYVLNPHGLVKG